MPIGIPLQPITPLDLTITLDQNLYQMVIRATNGCMCVSLTRNGLDILDNARAVAAGPIIPEQYQEAGDGNFMFLTSNNQLPNYEQFGVTQQLLYFSAEELAAFRVPPVAASPLVPTVTVDSFDPVGGLPLRFSPQGYVEG